MFAVTAVGVVGASFAHGRHAIQAHFLAVVHGRTSVAREKVELFGALFLLLDPVVQLPIRRCVVVSGSVAPQGEGFVSGAAVFSSSSGFYFGFLAAGGQEDYVIVFPLVVPVLRPASRLVAVGIYIVRSALVPNKVTLAPVVCTRLVVFAGIAMHRSISFVGAELHPRRFSAFSTAVALQDPRSIRNSGGIVVFFLLHLHAIGITCGLVASPSDSVVHGESGPSDLDSIFGDRRNLGKYVHNWCAFGAPPVLIITGVGFAAVLEIVIDPLPVVNDSVDNISGAGSFLQEDASHDGVTLLGIDLAVRCYRRLVSQDAEVG